MKVFIITALTFMFALLMWSNSDFRRFDENRYLPKEILDSAAPIDVTIDLDYLKGFNPAYDNK